MAKCNCLYEPFCSMLNGADILLPTPCEYRKDPANLVEVVRCKNCYNALLINRRLYCGPLCMCVDENNFCSYGERRTDNG